MSSDFALELRGIRKSFGTFVAVDELTLGIPAGSVFGLLGPNGAGKTTTLRMIMDIIAPDAGGVLFRGRPLTKADMTRVGYLPEERGLYRKMTVTEQLVFLARLHGMTRRAALAAIDAWLGRVGLAEWSRKKVEELSKGMQQKVQLVGTVLHDPELLILDEPFSGLDPINQSLFKELLGEHRRRGRTLIFSTHIMEQAEKLCDDICLISKGRAILSGRLAEIKRRYGGNSYRVEAEGDLGRLRTVPGVVEAIPQNGAVKLLLAPDADGARVLSELVSFLEVREFRSEEPSLEEIFISAVRDAG